MFDGWILSLVAKRGAWRTLTLVTSWGTGSAEPAVGEKTSPERKIKAFDSNN